MIRSKDLNLEIKALEDKVKAGEASNNDIVKAICLVAKLLRDVRTNQTRIMDAKGVKLIKPRTSADRPETEKKSEKKSE